MKSSLVLLNAVLIGVVSSQSYAFGTTYLQNNEASFTNLTYQYQQTVQHCGEGCKKCIMVIDKLMGKAQPTGGKLRCRSCDWENGYGYQDSTGCVKHDGDHCYIPGNIANSYLQATAMKLDRVPCQVCDQGYAPDSEGYCQEVKSVYIANCKQYQSSASE